MRKGGDVLCCKSWVEGSRGDARKKVLDLSKGWEWSGCMGY